MSAVSPAPRAGLRELLALAWPVVLSRATQSVVGLCDALMCARLGDRALAAAATGSLNQFSFSILPLGTVMLVQSFTAQLAGRGDVPATRRWAVYGLGIAAVSGVVGLTLSLTPWAGPLLKVFGFEPALHAEMTGYVRWRMWSLGPALAVEALAAWFAGLGDTRVAMRVSLVTMLANVALNWVFIWGHLGAPALGVRGAALASGLATLIGCALMALAFLRRQREVGGGAVWGLRLREALRLLRFGVPNGLNWFMEMSAFTLFLNLVVGGLGTTTLAAMNAILQLNTVSFMPAFGLASSGAVLVGHAIGRGDRDDVPRLVRLTFLVALVWQSAIGLVYLFLPQPLMAAFAAGAASRQLLALGVPMLMLSSVWQVFDAVGITLSEALRAAGDTNWCMWARLVAAWGLFLPGAWWWVRAGGGAQAAVGAVVVYIALLALLFAWRFLGGSWRRIELVEEPALD